MDHPLWLLVPWLVFAVGMGSKVWKLGLLLNRQLHSSRWGIEQFRAGLERTWRRNH
jgi:hypothetical protein